MGQQVLTFRGRGRVLPGTEDDVRPPGQGLRVGQPGQLLGGSIGVHPHLPEIVAKSPFHKGSRGGLQRGAAGMQHLLSHNSSPRSLCLNVSKWQAGASDAAPPASG